MAIGLCRGCGCEIDGGGPGCRSRFDAFLARDYSDARYFGAHRLLVDAYCLQHPEEFCRSAKSLAAHLAGLCWILEEGAPSSVGSDKLRRWLNGNRTLPRPELPKERGRLTIADLPDAADPAAWEAAVRRWAEATWIAYRPLHPLARQWLAEAQAH